MAQIKRSHMTNLMMSVLLSLCDVVLSHQPLPLYPLPPSATLCLEQSINTCQIYVCAQFFLLMFKGFKEQGGQDTYQQQFSHIWGFFGVRVEFSFIK